MGTFNGERYIEKQLQSICNQTYKDWDLWISDDGSNDKTLEICRKFQKDQINEHQVRILNGPRKGFSANFLSLVKRVQSGAEYYCFADQDDIWLKQKIERAIGILQKFDKNTPALYCGRTELINADGVRYSPPKLSRLRKCQPSFSNSLAQSLASGNTMVFNNCARGKLLKSLPTINVPSHDWWAYIIISGCGGKVIYDPEPYVLYRQHDRNTIGDNSGLLKLIKRGRKFLKSEYRKYNDENAKALFEHMEVLTDQNKEIYHLFQKARTKGHGNLSSLYKSGVSREGLTNIGLWLGCLINKI